jgi:hypothetical protein
MVMAGLAALEDSSDTASPEVVEQVWVAMIECLLPHDGVANGAAHDA